MYTDLTDAEIHRLWTRDRDQGAAKALHQHSHRIVVARLARRLFSLPDPEQEARGVADEAYMRALTHYDARHGSFRGYWLTVAENLAMDLLRKRSGFTTWCLRLDGAVLETKSGRSRPLGRRFAGPEDAAAAAARARRDRESAGYVPRAERRDDGWSCFQRVYAPEGELGEPGEPATDPFEDDEDAALIARVRAWIIANYSVAEYDAVHRAFDDVSWAENARLHPDQPSPDALRMRVKKIVRRAAEES